tara:strand:- start:307 stop:768 length:462 start_codon:yes stop_codon:yes gene_type:complete
MSGKEKNELIIALTEHFKVAYNVSCSEAKIWSIIILETNKNGITFEEIIHKTGIGKSTVSTGLKKLLSKKHILFETKDGQRKKYFQPSSMNKLFIKIQEEVNSEIDLVDKVIFYTETKKEEFPEHISVDLEIYKECLTEIKIKIAQILMSEML